MARGPLKESMLSSSGDGYRLQFKLVGEWKSTMDIIKRLPAAMKSSSLEAQVKLGDDVVKRVKKHLRNQDLGWRPLSSETSAKKNLKGLDSRILFAWGNYYNNIKVWKVGNQKALLIGVRTGIHTRSYGGRKSKYDIARIAAIHEFSSGKRVPRRPLWNPTIAEYGIRGFKELYLKFFKARLRANRIPFKTL